ncbi:MAG: sugar-binding protein [Woeseiaceae bacterium]
MSYWTRIISGTTDEMGATATLVLAMLTTLAVNDTASAEHLAGRTQTTAPFAEIAPTVDGKIDDDIWASATWRPIANNWLGPAYSADDFEGKFKVAWSKQRLYIIVEFTDDTLYDGHRHPLEQYWDDDCLEIFIDEDYSGGEHQQNHNAFAYHFSLDNQAIDIGTDGKAQTYTSHTESQWRQHADKVIWEVSIALHPDTYRDGIPEQSPVDLFAGKTIGLMVAYCDNDGSELRENFIGSEAIQTGAKDRGYIDANVFGAVVLVEGS